MEAEQSAVIKALKISVAFCEARKAGDQDQTFCVIPGPNILCDSNPKHSV